MIDWNALLRLIPAALIEDVLGTVWSWCQALLMTLALTQIAKVVARGVLRRPVPHGVVYGVAGGAAALAVWAVWSGGVLERIGATAVVWVSGVWVARYGLRVLRRAAPRWYRVLQGDR